LIFTNDKSFCLQQKHRISPKNLISHFKFKAFGLKENGAESYFFLLLIFFYYGGVVAWFNRKQKSISLSKTEAECLKAIAETVKRLYGCVVCVNQTNEVSSEHKFILERSCFSVN